MGRRGLSLLGQVYGHESEARERPAIQMCDALARNVPKLAAGVEILLAHCLAHGRRQFVEVAANFPDQCRYVLEMGLRSEERLQFHQGA